MAAVGDAKEKRDSLMLHALVERRVVLEGETRDLRTRTVELRRHETELRDEIATLDGILGARPETPPAPAVPGPVEASTTAPSTATAAPRSPPPAKKRRRKGTRREEILPKLRAKLGSGTFTTEDVTDVVLEADGGERRKAYFAAWSLVRDLGEDGVVDVVAEEGSGPRKKRTYRFAEALASTP